MNNNRQKTIVWAIIAVVALVIIAGIGYMVWNKVQEQTTPVKTQTLTEKAETAKQSGIKAEADGQSEKALEQYQTALDAYKQAGDKAAAEDMSYKVQFMKDAIEAGKKAAEQAIKNGDKPVSDEWQ